MRASAQSHFCTYLYYIIADFKRDFKMRMRKKKHSAERIEACAEFLLKNPIECFEKEEEIFGKKCPMLLEIGCGKGDFARGLSKMYPDHGIIALERVPDVARKPSGKNAVEQSLKGGWGTEA